MGLIDLFLIFFFLEGAGRLSRKRRQELADLEEGEEALSDDHNGQKNAEENLYTSGRLLCKVW